MQRPVFLAAFLMAAVLCSGCPDRQAAQKPAQPPLKIAVCLADLERDGNRIIKNVMDSRKKEDRLDIIWLDAKNDRLRQEEQLKKLPRQKVEAVVLQPVDPVTGPEVMRGLVEKKIKVVALETLPADVPVDAYVAPDHVLAGQLLARFAINTARKGAGLPVSPGAAANTALQGQGALQNRLPIGVALIGGDPKDAAAGEIAAAARAALRGSAEVRLVAEEQVPQGNPGLVPGITQRLLAEKGNGIQAVLATDSRLALEAVQALKSAGLNNRVLTAGVGADEKASMALAAGEHDAEVDTRPDLLGQYALDAAIRLARDGHWEYSGQIGNGSYSVPSRIMPVRLITSGNAYLLEQRWGGLQGKKEEGGGGQKQGESGGGRDGEGEGGRQSPGQGDGQDQKRKTMLRITTRDGKTMEVQVDGEIKKIESLGEGEGKGR